MTKTAKVHHQETADVREKRAEILRLAQNMTPEQRKMLIAALEKMVQNRS